MTTGTAVPCALERLGVIMEDDPDNPDEAWGVLNPACCRGRDGMLYLYPRVVAALNKRTLACACEDCGAGGPILDWGALR